MSIEDSRVSENNDETLELPLRLSKICLLNIRDDNAFISPLAIEAAFHALINSNQKLINEKLPLYFYNYFIVNQEFISQDFNENVKKNLNTEFRFYILTDNEQRKNILNEILNDFSQQILEPIVVSQKNLGQIIIEPMTLISCCSFSFQPLNSEYWEQIWSLKFQTNIHLTIETEFYFTKGFFRIAFHETFQKIEIPGQLYHGIPMNLIILLPRCSSDLVHLYANIKEYINLPYTSAFIGVCIPKISMDVDINLIESLKLFNLEKFNKQIYLSGARSFGHFSFDISSNNNDIKTSSKTCVHSIDLSPVTPWIFFANRPFLFFITYGNSYLLIGQMLSPKIRHTTKEYFSKIKTSL